MLISSQLNIAGTLSEDLWSVPTEQLSHLQCSTMTTTTLATPEFQGAQQVLSVPNSSNQPFPLFHYLETFSKQVSWWRGGCDANQGSHFICFLSLTILQFLVSTVWRTIFHVYYLFF